MVIEKDFFAATKRVTVVEGDVSYPYMEVGSEEGGDDIRSFEFFTKELLQEFIDYLIQVKERWN